jgi:selenocysteine lyase/cysteine desulfurase
MTEVPSGQRIQGSSQVRPEPTADACRHGCGRQSTASRRTTELFESAYDTIAAWLNAPSRRRIATYRNTTEALNAVMYSLLTEFRDGDNVVTTMLEHNSNFVP